MTQNAQTPLAWTQRSNGWGFQIIRAILGFLAQAYFRLDVRGLRHIPRHGGAIIAGNHPSVLDGILLLAVCPRPVRFLVAENFYNHLLLKPLFRAVGSIEVYRTKTHNGDALRMAVAALEQGELIGIFPEGTVHFGGTMQHVKQGVALLALRTGCPVIPLGIRGSREAFPPDAKIPFPRPIRLRFDAPMVFPKVASGRIPERQVLFVREQIRQRILNVVTLAHTTPTEARAYRMGKRSMAQRLKGFVRMRSMSPRLLLSRPARLFSQKIAQKPASKHQDRNSRISILLASHQERETIYRLRHAVYASELRQHEERSEGTLSDALDDVNIYIVARISERIVGFVSLTPPTAKRFSIEKYLSREDLPFQWDGGVYEVRLLTVDPAYRGRRIASLLMYAALRWVETSGGTRIIAMGRREVLDFYRKVGLQTLGRAIQSGAVTFELMSATPGELRAHIARYSDELQQVQGRIDWQLSIPFDGAPACYHGGAFWEAIGESFGTMERKDQVINADVLDAWFPPPPTVLTALQAHLPWLIRTSPPTNSEGFIRTIADVRGIAPECIVPGAGSSSLVFLAFRLWLRPSSRVLILDPTYGEYPHVLEQVIRCNVDRLALSREEAYQLDPDRLAAQTAKGYDLIVLVNPNSPTGQYVPRQELESVLKDIPQNTRVWVDETYIDYVGSHASLEPFAMRSKNVIVCKSMSKVYALSGLRVAYLCAPVPVATELRALTPPWAVSLPAQVAAVAALQEPEYYAARYRETHVLRAKLVEGLSRLDGIEIVPSVANWVLCHLPLRGNDATTVCRACQHQGLFLRDLSSLSPRLGNRGLRIAVKDAQVNQRIVDILARVLEDPQRAR